VPPTDQQPLRIAAPAKVNLHLRVGPPTPDGFHPLLSWMVTVGLFDTLEFVPTVAQPGISLLCDDPAIPVDASNLVVKTASALLDGSQASPPDHRRAAGLGWAGLFGCQRTRPPLPGVMRVRAPGRAAAGVDGRVLLGFSRVDFRIFRKPPLRVAHSDAQQSM
jgi:hypothetical protein